MKKNKLAVDNGISLQCYPINNERIKIPFLSSIILALLSFITTLSALMTLSTMLHLKIQPAVVIYATVGFCAFFSIVYGILTSPKAT